MSPQVTNTSGADGLRHTTVRASGSFMPGSNWNAIPRWGSMAWAIPASVPSAMTRGRVLSPMFRSPFASR